MLIGHLCHNICFITAAVKAAAKAAIKDCKKQSLFKPNIFKCALTFHNFVSTLKAVTGLLDVLTIEIAHTYGQTVSRPALDEAEEGERPP